jgi:predicted  nucleic acid-binding Zn-ribbon protein
VKELETLLAVQELDSAVDRLLHQRDNLPRARELRTQAADLEEMAREVEQMDAELTQFEKLVGEIEGELEAVSARIASLDKQMYSGTVSNARDLQAMSHEIDLLKERRSHLEEQALEGMEKVEEFRGRMEELKEKQLVAQASLAILEEAVASERREIDEEVAKIISERNEVAGRVQADLLERYDSLRKRLGGVAIAPLVGGRCEGCHLSLSVVALDRIRHQPPGTLCACEECGRILVPRD